MSKTVIITGGSRGIGAAAARLCGKRGWSVAINYAGNEEAARATARAVEAGGGKAITVKGDMSVEADVVALFDSAAKAFGTIDAVVNNAGILERSSPIAEMSAERIRRIVDVNLFGALLVAREAARRMSTARGGRGGVLVNLSSAAAKLGAPGEAVDYAATKGAIEAMNLGLAPRRHHPHRPRRHGRRGGRGDRVAHHRPGELCQRRRPRRDRRALRGRRPSIPRHR
jgi:NAD(P)-dependent dehydrogenase (short-subunit alcohol dehydrogenase family)